MLIDLHNHTNLYSICSMISPDDLIEACIKAEIDGLCITEHNVLWDEDKQKKLQNKYSDKIKIFFGIEVSTDIGHVLVFGKSKDNYPESTKFDDLLKIKSNDTAIVWAHPFRWKNIEEIIITEKIIKSFDAIELYNGNLDDKTINLTYDLLNKHNVKFTGGSDTHSASMACKYATKFDNENINSIEDFVRSLKTEFYKPEIIHK